MASSEHRVGRTIGWIYMILCFIFLFLPIVTLITFSFNSSRYPSLPWRETTLFWYRDLVKEGTLLQGLKHSFMVSPAAAATATVIGFFVAYVTTRFNFKGKNAVIMFVVAPIVIPPIILGVAFLGFLSPLRLSGHLFSIYLAHVVVITPIAMAMITLRLSQIPPQLEEAAWNLGATEWQAIRKVIVPWALPGIAGGALLAFTFSFDEFLIAWFVTGFSETLPVRIYTFMGSSLNPSINAVGTIVFGITIGLITIAEMLLVPQLLRRRKPAGIVRETM